MYTLNVKMPDGNKNNVRNARNPSIIDTNFQTTVAFFTAHPGANTFTRETKHTGGPKK